MGDVLSSTVFLGEKCWRDWGGGRSWRPPQGTVVPLLSTRKRQVQSGRKGGEGGWGVEGRQKGEREKEREERGREQEGRDELVEGCGCCRSTLGSGGC